MKYNKLSIFTFCVALLMCGTAFFLWSGRGSSHPILLGPLFWVVLSLPFIVLFAGVVSLYQIRHCGEKGTIFSFIGLVSVFVLGAFVWKLTVVLGQM